MHRVPAGLCALLLCAALAWSSARAAETYPSRVIRVIVPVAAAGMTDTVARTIAQRLHERLGQNVAVENRPGAGGIIGTEAVARAAPDGYTLLMAYPGPLVVNPYLYASLPYDVVRDFAPVNLFASYPMVIAVNPAVPAKTLAEFITLARDKPGSINYASAGNATTAHLAMELLSREAGIRMVHVPYKGAAPAMTDLLSGRVSAAFDSMTLIMPQVQSGKLRALAISSRERSRAAPDLPTVAESGLKNFEVVGWYGLVAPAGTPRQVIDRLSREMVAIVAEPALRKDFEGRGLEPLAKGPGAFAEFLEEERVKWRRVVTESNIKVD